MDEHRKKNDSIKISDKIDYLFKIIARYDTYINSTNAKASLIIAWNGVVIGAVLLKFDSIVKMYESLSCGSLIAKIFITLIGLCSVISNILVFRVVFPFLKATREKKSKRKSLIFFGSVASMGNKEYIEKFKTISEEDFLDDITEQAAVIAEGLNIKMKNMKWSIEVIYGGLVFIAIMILIKLLFI